MLSWLITLLFHQGAIAHPLLRTEVAQSQTQGFSCPPPVLSSLRNHKVAPGETIDSIAQKYNLLPETLIRFNPTLEAGSAPVGKVIVVPPYNGVRLDVPAGATWQDLANAYGIRADILFELNGCQKIPKTVFIPGVTWTATGNPQQNNYTGLKSYPLPQTTSVGLPYGWQKNPTNGETLFHSGIDLLAEPGTPVLAADDGTVAFVGQEGTYGNLIVIEHGQQRQTRYAHLATLGVKIGQQVKAGEQIGTIGATGQPDIKASHLHFEVRFKLPVGWVAQDPMLNLPAKGSN